MRYSLSMKRMLTIFFGVSLFSLSVTLMLFVKYANDTTKDVDRIIHTENVVGLFLNEMWAQGLQTEQALRNIMLNPKDERALANFQDAGRAFEGANEKVLALAGAESIPVLREIQEKWTAIGAVKNDIRQLASQGKHDEAVLALNQRETPLWRDIKSLILGRIEAQKKLFAASFEKSQHDASMGKTVFVGLTAFFLLLLSVLSLVMWRAISNPLTVMVEYTRRVASGDFSAHIEQRFASEFENLKDHLNTMTEELKTSLGFSRSVMEGFRQPFMTVDPRGRVTSVNKAALDLLEITEGPEAFTGKKAGYFFYQDEHRETKVERLIKEGNWSSTEDVQLVTRNGHKVLARSDRTQLKDLDGNVIGGIATYMDLTAIKTSESLAVERTEKIHAAAVETGKITVGLFEAVEGLSNQIRMVAKGAATQRDRAEQTSSAMDTMLQTLSVVAKNAEAASTAALLTEEKALAGADVVERSIEAIQQVSVTAADLGKNMRQLGEHSESIGKVINVISDIADQTNLLALNAAIEAARAGDSGRGFAVVADEVRKLAEKTMVATHEVIHTIGAIQESARRNLEHMDDATHMIDQATALAGQSGLALKEIVSMAQTTADSSKEIVSASRGQASTADDIARSAQEVRQIADQTDGGMNQAASAVEGLSRIAGSLKGLVERLSA